MAKFKGFKKQIKAVEKAISKKRGLEKQIRAGKIKKEIEVRKSILAKRSGFFKGSEEDIEVPRKQMIFLGRV